MPFPFAGWPKQTQHIFLIFFGIFTVALQFSRFLKLCLQDRVLSNICPLFYSPVARSITQSGCSARWQHQEFMRSKEGSKLVPNLFMEEEEEKGGDAGRFSLVLCRFSLTLCRIPLILCSISLIFVQFFHFQQESPHSSAATHHNYLGKASLDSPTLSFTTFNHFRAAVRFIRRQTTSPFTRLSPQPQSEQIIHYRSISFDFFPHPQLPFPAPKPWIKQLPGSPQSRAISPKLKALLCRPTGPACWDRLLLISP